jgi:hypothetical protein
VMIATERVSGMNSAGSVTSQIPLTTCHQIFSGDSLEFRRTSHKLEPHLN